ncbi:MAG TPA: ABC transporter ATP-binding protein, partial [Tissierellaceae bacterium]|nr:ABC transporter ATP-binding protein [Tissierellaceae bacterium]
MSTPNEEINSRERVYDIRLFKRLLGYALPYWKFLLLSLILLIVITGLELLNPYLLKISIDEYINGNQKPIYQIDIDSPIEGIEFNNYKYVRKDNLSKEEKLKLKDQPVKKIVKRNDVPYLVDFYNEDEKVALDQDTYSRFREEDIQGINRVSFYFFITILFTFLFNYLQIYLLNYTGQRIIFNIREEVFNHILNLSVAYFDKNPIGRLVTRVTNDTEALNEMYTSVLVNLFKDVFTLVGIIVIMLKMDHKLALLSFLLLPLILTVAIIFRRKIRVVYRLARAQLAMINTNLNEYISGMRTIQIFKKEKKISNKFDYINQKYLDTSRREVQIYATLRPSIEIIRSLGIAALIYFGGGKVISSRMEFGMLYIFVDYLQRFFNPILDLT